MDAENRTAWIANQLLKLYGKVEAVAHNPLETLIGTILSQNTKDSNRDRAYASLVARFGSLAAVNDAPVEEIAQAIRIGGLHRQKASRIKQVLERIMHERGSLDLSFLDGLSLYAALTWLLASPGIGNKTAGIVLLFSFDKPYFPVDTHIRRIIRRIGIVAPNEDPHARMNALLPPDPALMRRLHLQMIRLGREICHPRRPECHRCPLSERCAYYAEEIETKQALPSRPRTGKI